MDPLSTKQSRVSILRSILEIFGIIFMRFRPLQRIWGIWLVAVNAASLIFINHLEALIALGAVGVVVLMQALIYQRKRFIRILGVTHILWLPMLAWMAMRIPTLPDEERGLRSWLIALIATNLLSLVIDAWDATRFILGERNPYYAW